MSEEEFLEVLQTRKYRGVNYLDNGEVIVSYDREISKNICETNDLDFKDVLIKIMSGSNKKLLQGDKHNSVSIATASAITAYSRIYINKIKLDILNKGGHIYYSDTDSVVTDIKLDENLVGSEIGKLKLEHEITEGYFISNKTYCFKNKKGETIIKNKGVFINKLGNGKIVTPFKDDKEYKSLAYDDFKKLYLGDNVKTFRYESERNINVGYVTIKKPNKLKLSFNSYTKRTKVFNNKNI